MATFDPRELCGWVDFPEGVAYQKAQMPFPKFASAAPELMGMGADQDILLYKAWKEVLGKYPSYVAQAIGDCTSFGTGHAIDLTECIQVALDHQALDWKETCTEALYGAGREIANMLGRGDGCYGAALAQAATQVGVLPREAVGSYSGRRAQQWGASGTPADVKQKMGEHKVGATSCASTLAELDAGLANGYVSTVCSNQGFTLQRDQDGFCSPHGRWPHCMMIAARRGGPRPGYLICQSWGANMPTGPQVMDQPDFSFWADASVVASMLSGQDSFLFSKFNGYPGRPLPSNWTVRSWAGF